MTDNYTESCLCYNCNDNSFFFELCTHKSGKSLQMEALFLIAAGEGTRQLGGCGHRQGEKTESARSVCVCPFWGTLGASV